jgi:hypothetical protein
MEDWCTTCEQAVTVVGATDEEVIEHGGGIAIYRVFDLSCGHDVSARLTPLN